MCNNEKSTPPERFEITPIREEHAAGFHAALDAVARERLYLKLVAAPPLDAVRASVLEAMARGVARYVALCDGKVIGWCDISPDPHEGFRHSGELGMGVIKAFRKQGAGSRLLRATLARAREIGLQRVELEVFASNADAIHLYAKEGFLVEGVKKHARRIDGYADDIIIMALAI